MYQVKRNRKHISVIGPGGWSAKLKTTDVGIVLRQSVHWPHEEAVAYAVLCRDMTNAEIVGQALEIESYPV